MAKESLEEMIKKTSEEYRDRDSVALIGNTDAGKTVVLALLKHTLAKSWIPNTNGKWEATVHEGAVINQIIRDMEGGKFPSPTPEKNFPNVTIDIFNMRGRPVKFELMLHDISGESYSEFMTDSYGSIDERLAKILSTGASYLAHAKKYLIIIDCTEIFEWDTDKPLASAMIRTINGIKKRIHNYGDSERLHSPVAIIFTKADALPDEMRHLSARELLLRYPELRSSLASQHDGKSLGLFKVCASSHMESHEDIEKKLELERAENEAEYQRISHNLKMQVGATIQAVKADAKAEAARLGYTGKELKDHIAHRIAMINRNYQEQLERLEQATRPSIDLEPRWELDVPLKYTESEYIRLISWILEIDDGNEA